MNLTPAARLARLSPARRAAFEQRLLDRSPRPISAIVSRPYAGPVPLSFAQQRLWYVDQLDPHQRVNNVPRALRVRGPLNIEALRNSLQLIVDRHEGLRTTLPVLKDRRQPMQVVHAAASAILDIPLLDLPRGVELGPFLQTEAERRFDLTNDLPVRGRLLRLGVEDHLLQLTVHHIASDGWSAGIFDRELMAAYAGLAAGTPPDMAPLPIQYRNFSEWQHEQVRSGALDGQLTYWREQLADSLPSLRLNSGRRRPAIQTFKGEREHFTLPRALVERLRALSRRYHATLFTTLLAAFQALLARHAHQTDIVVGSPVAGRGRPETNDLIGCFINSVALRAKVLGDATFGELLGQVREVVLGALSNQDLPFDRLVQELRPVRDSSASPVFQVMFVLQNTRASRLSLPGLDIEDIAIETHAARLDLTLVLEDVSGELSGFAEYNTDVFDQATVVRLLDQFTRLLTFVAEDPDRRLATIPLLNPAEQQRVLVDWNAPRAIQAPSTTILTAFLAQVARSPGAIAVRNGDATLTYGELNRRADQAAQALRRLGVTDGVAVGLSLDRSIEVVVATLAILKAGGMYVPLNPAYPRERLELMIRDTDARVVLNADCWSSLVDGLEPHDAAVVVTTTTPDSAAYIMYTSGSTGQPKGVVVPHRAVVGLVQDTNYVQLTPDDRVAFASDLAFDAATFELWGALLNGAQLIVLDKDTVLSPRGLAVSLQAQRVTTLFLTTAAFNRCAREYPAAFSGLRQLLFGGEAADIGSVRKVLSDRPPERLLNVYGPTETTTFATWYQVEAVSDSAETVPIGRPVGGTSVYVLDEQLQPVPIGVAGELYIGGSRLAFGYLNQPQVTTQHFVNDPFSSQPGARLYRTGDLVRWTADGQLVFVGRTDDQVKIRGFRVEPAEVESRLVAHPQVREVTIVPRLDTLGTRQLVAYVVAECQPGPTPASLRSFLALQLPEYMLPSAYITLQALPLRPNGKLDIEKLPPVPTDRPDLAPAFIAPRTDTERSLQEIWADVLGLEQPGIRDNFFDLGGHSLLAAEVFSRIEDRLQVRLPLASLFPLPTIERQAELIDADSSVVAPRRVRSSLVPIQPRGSKPPFVCVHAIDGDVLRFEPLARSLGTDQPFYGVRAYGLDEDVEPAREIEAIAAGYVDDLCTAFDGPYLLGGFSSGATLAFEMARQLVARGRQVGLVALLDGAAPVREDPLPTRLRADLSYLLPDLRSYVEHALAPDQRMALARFKFSAVRRSIERWTHPTTSSLTQGMSAEVLEAVAEFSERHHVVARAHHAAMLQYVPQTYPGRLLVVRGSIRRLLSLHDRTLGWAPLARDGVDVVHISAGHDALLKDPHVRTLAAALNAAIAQSSG